MILYRNQNFNVITYFDLLGDQPKYNENKEILEKETLINFSKKRAMKL